MKEFYCVPLNETITTQKRWLELCRQYRSDEAAATQNGYKFNIHNVCLNPSKPIDVKTKTYQYSVETCKYNNSFFVGSVFGTNSGGGCSPCAIDRQGFTTEREAKRSELLTLLHWFECAKIPKAIKDIRTELFNLAFVQLELF